MRVLRFLRPERSSAAAAADANAPSDAVGLEAFATETTSAAVTSEHTVTPRLRVALIVLGALAAIESVPAALWVQGQFSPVQQASVAAATPPAPMPPSAVEAAPCTPEPAPVQTAANTAANSGAVTAGSAATTAPAMVAGLVAIDTPVPMQVFERGRLIGTTEAETMMLSVGTHDLELVNEPVGFRARRTVNVVAGRTSSVRVEAPRAPLHVNAIPWAEVWIDNQRVGETPLGNLQQTIGTHEVVFRHPELGERRTTVLVTLKEPARVSMDLRKK